jgi:hypothetical protein
LHHAQYAILAPERDPREGSDVVAVAEERIEPCFTLGRLEQDRLSASEHPDRELALRERKLSLDSLAGLHDPLLPVKCRELEVAALVLIEEHLAVDAAAGVHDDVERIGENLGKVEGPADRGGKRVEGGELVVLEQYLALEEPLLAQVAEVDEHHLSVVEAQSASSNRNRKNPLFLGLEGEVVVDEVRRGQELLEVVDGSSPARARVEVLDTQVEELPPAVAGEALRLLVRIQTKAVCRIEEKGRQRKPLEGGAVLPARRIGFIPRKRVERRLCRASTPANVDFERPG